MGQTSTIAVLVLLAYGLGATPFGFLAGKASGIDIRRHGSGNIGATNAMRVLGRAVGIPVFILDVAKGALPVILTRWWCSRHPAFQGDEPAIQVAEVCAGLAAVLGHNYTFWLGFRGGKGIATSAGVILGLAPLVLPAVFAVWLGTWYLTGFVSVASIAAGLALPLAVAVAGSITGRPHWPLLALSIFIGLLAVWRHRANIQRLRAGTEPRRGQTNENRLT